MDRQTGPNQLAPSTSSKFTSNLNLKYIYFLKVGGGGLVDGWTDEQAQTNLLIQHLRGWGITMHKCTSYGPDKFNL